MASPDEMSPDNDLQKTLKFYNEGKPLFTRAVLEDLDRHLEKGENKVVIRDYLDNEHVYDLEIPDWCADSVDTVRIKYNGIETLTTLHPDENKVSWGTRTMMITYGSHYKYDNITVEKVRTAFERQWEAWKQSKTCKHLTQQLEKLTPNQVAAITKIVGFALGPVACLDVKFADGIGPSAANALTQHMALLTIAKILEQQNGGRKVKCYTQDPVNKGVGNESLKTLGITSLDDPKGFLEVDDKTLVVSIHPNVPVRQVIADLQYPAAMLWNTVEEPVKREWEQKIMDDGDVTWIFPYSTDPVSSRVVRMTEQYDQLPFDDADDWFGKLTWYVMKHRDA
ncbi:uncharacterized protein EURHEDRAFT_412584 [Aspergillus ruber CBS 135680]|uniref:SRR1-like domain-containing protein n=1 Tax=Aspergillus ruber (strain CBS 135680) TaxID=1388766 RepID=A0A017SEU2_ASPRC|nr:uncharacterized protein EURHEDRAFT_412584 [Aspergillus ruber CBS 135680]EYE94765.1 hypothetical protein EURHEDRAFT_412584 [Aspergillus ruber CBS 135680]